MTLVSLVTLAILVGLTYKVLKFQKKIERLYDYFIKSESKMTPEEFMIKSLVDSELPPMNGECPTKEELENTIP